MSKELIARLRIVERDAAINPGIVREAIAALDRAEQQKMAFGERVREEAAKVAETVQDAMWTKWSQIALEQFVLGRNKAAAAIRALDLRALGKEE